MTQRPFVHRDLIIAGAVFVVLSLGAQSGTVDSTDKLPELPGAMLLVGGPPRSLFLTTEKNTWTLQDNKESLSWIGASISADGRTVASARLIPGTPFIRGKMSVVVSTYSMIDHKWTDRNNLEILTGTIAISRDGENLACVVRERPDMPAGLRILRLKTGEMRVGPKLKEHSAASLSWSPDSRRIVLSNSWHPVTGAETDFSIYILDVATGAISKLADGLAASWAPSGKWIAFVESAGGTRYNKYHLKLIRPDGTDSRVIMKFESDVIPRLKPVWSPDSQSLLFNVSRDPDEDTWDIYQVDTETLKNTKRFKNTRVKVYGWVAVD